MNVSILGFGSWGTAFAVHLSNIGHAVKIYARDNDLVKSSIKSRINEKYLPGIMLNDRINITSSVGECLKGCDIAIIAISTQNIRLFLEENHNLFEKVPIVSLSKGIEIGTNLRVSEIIKEYLENDIVVLTGPSHAEEVSRNIPTVLLSASKNYDLAKYIQKEFSSEYLRIYTSKDYKGAELAAAIKNIIAIAVGISDGVGFGDNTKAAIITRSLSEMIKLTSKMGADKNTFLGISGIGDLIVTCTSKHSRNRKFGELIGKGLSIDEAIKEVGMVVEGLPTLKSIYSISKEYGIEMPIVNKLMKILFTDIDIKDATSDLMNRKYKDEK